MTTPKSDKEMSVSDYEKEWYKSKIALLESDLKTAHEMIREFRKELEFYGDKKNWYELVEGEHKICGTFKVVKYWTDCGYEYDIDGVADEGKRARAVLSKHAEFLKKIGLGHDKK